jgi:hypothetical protein
MGKWRPMGDYVMVNGRCGKITSDVGTSNPYKVTFDNGEVSGGGRMGGNGGGDGSSTSDLAAPAPPPLTKTPSSQNQSLSKMVHQNAELSVAPTEGRLHPHDVLLGLHQPRRLTCRRRLIKHCWRTASPFDLCFRPMQTMHTCDARSRRCSRQSAQSGSARARTCRRSMARMTR